MLAIFGVCLWITWSTLVVLVVMALLELDKVQKTYLIPDPPTRSNPSDFTRRQIEWEKLNVSR